MISGVGGLSVGGLGTSVVFVLEKKHRFWGWESGGTSSRLEMFDIYGTRRFDGQWKITSESVMRIKW